MAKFFRVPAPEPGAVVPPAPIAGIISAGVLGGFAGPGAPFLVAGLGPPGGHGCWYPDVVLRLSASLLAQVGRKTYEVLGGGRFL